MLLRVVLDTNVILSGLLKPQGTPGRIVGAWREGSLHLVLSEFLLDEVAAVLAGSKFEKLLGWPTQQIARFVLELRALSEVVAPADLELDDLRDADDAPILAALVASKADVLVTGDGDLLALRDRYPIETPAEFARRRL